MTPSPPPIMKQQATTNNKRYFSSWICSLLLLFSTTTTLAQDPACTAPEPFDFEGLWIFQLSGVQAPINETTQLALELAIELSFRCEDDVSETFYDLYNVSVRLDLLDALFLVQDDDNEGLISTDLSPLAIPVSLQGNGNLVALGHEEDDEEDEVVSFFSPPPEDDDPTRRRHSLLRRELDDDVLCPCQLPTKEVFLDTLRLELSQMTDPYSGIRDVIDVTEMTEIDCPPNTTNVTTFSAGIAVDMIGNVELVTDRSLQAYANLVIDMWNTLNFYENCDVTSAWLISGTAALDADATVLNIDVTSLLAALTGEEFEGDGGDNRKRRNLETISASEQQQSVYDYQGRRRLQEDSLSSSLWPSEEPTGSIAPSSSAIPTQPPTARGPDLFRLLITLTGICRGCASDTNLFLEVMQRKLQESATQTWRQQRNHQEAAAVASTATAAYYPAQPQQPRFLSHINSNNSSYTPDDCFCPIGVLEDGPGVPLQGFFEAINQAIPAEFDFADEIVIIQEVNVFTCTEDALASLGTFVFEGQIDLVDPQQVEDLIVDTYNDLAAETCDPFVRRLDEGQTLNFVLLELTESPSEMPSRSSAPSTSSAPSELPGDSRRMRRNLQDDEGSSEVPSEAPTTSTTSSEMPTAVPTIVSSREGTSSNPSTTSSSEGPSVQPSVNSNTDQPTFAPTARGPDLFSIMMSLTGTCNGCTSELGLFDEINLSYGSRRRQRKTRQQDNSAGADRSSRGLEEEGLCACPLDADPIGVSLEIFLEALRARVVGGNITGIEDIIGGSETTTESPTAGPEPSVSLTPSTRPSQSLQPSSSPRPSIPGETLTIDLELPSETPSETPSKSPSSPPSLSPSLYPSEFPSEYPSGFPSTTPSGSPSTLPSLSPSTSPSGAPSESPSESPSQSPSTSPSIFPSTSPSTAPSESPSTSPSTAPSTSPSTAPSTAPSAEPSSAPSDAPSVSAAPSSQPSSRPSLSVVPSTQPSSQPSSTPSSIPSSSPSVSNGPSSSPSLSPSASSEPSSGPSNTPSLSVVPSMEPSLDPTAQPTTCVLAGQVAIPRTDVRLCNEIDACVDEDGNLADGDCAAPTDLEVFADEVEAVGSYQCVVSLFLFGIDNDCQRSFPGIATFFKPDSTCLSTTHPAGDGPATVEVFLFTNCRLVTDSPSNAPSQVPSNQPSLTPTGSPSLSSLPTIAPSGSPSKEPSLTPSLQPSQSPSDVPSQRPSRSPSEVPSQRPSRQASSEPSGSPSDTPSQRPSKEASSSPSESPSWSGMPSLAPSRLPSAEPSKTPTKEPSRSPSNVPSLSPSLQPSSFPSDIPSKSISPSASPSREESNAPSMSSMPTKTDTTPAPSESIEPTSTPSTFPSNAPSRTPTGAPSSIPSGSPSGAPSNEPSTGSPSSTPSQQPSGVPSLAPTKGPSNAPSISPSGMPSGEPSKFPTEVPSVSPSGAPSSSPSKGPTRVPSGTPSNAPTKVASGSPSSIPTSSPSLEPTTACSAILVPNMVTLACLVSNGSVRTEDQTISVQLVPTRRLEDESGFLHVHTNTRELQNTDTCTVFVVYLLDGLQCFQVQGEVVLPSAVARSNARIPCSHEDPDTHITTRVVVNDCSATPD